MLRLWVLLAALVSAPLSAQGLTVRMGETWLFAIDKGQPVAARKVDSKAAPAAGQIKVSLRPMMGTTMSVINNSRFDYAYRATLIMPDGKVGAAKSCAVPANGRLAMEHWSTPVAAVRLSNFKPAPAGSLCP